MIVRRRNLVSIDIDGEGMTISEEEAMELMHELQKLFLGYSLDQADRDRAREMLRGDIVRLIALIQDIDSGRALRETPLGQQPMDRLRFLLRALGACYFTLKGRSPCDPGAGPNAEEWLKLEEEAHGDRV